MDFKKMILSGGMLVFVAAVVVGGTGAFFSDTETSTGNVFTAGSVSVGLGAIQHAYNADGSIPDDYFESSTSNNIPFFTFNDLKPLDTGNISFELNNGENPAHMCAMIQGDPAAGLTAADAELYDMLNFYQADGTQVTPGEWFDLGDVAANTTENTGVDYCFGDPVLSGGLTGCEHGGLDYNPAQGGSFSADIMFYAVQTRNNEDFSCGDLTPDEAGGWEYNPDANTGNETPND